MERLYAIRVGPSSVEAWSVARLPFEPIGWALAFRNDLRDALRQALPVEGARLHAIYGGRDQPSRRSAATIFPDLVDAGQMRKPDSTRGARIRKSQTWLLVGRSSERPHHYASSRDCLRWEVPGRR